MKEQAPKRGRDAIEREKEHSDVLDAKLKQPSAGTGASPQERQEDTGKTEVQDFFRQDKSGLPKQQK